MKAPPPITARAELTETLDLDQMTERLSPLLQPFARANMAPRLTSARLLDYKPATGRGVIGYTVAGARRGWSQVYGKLFPDADGASRVCRMLQLLQTQVFDDAPITPSGPQALGYLIQPPLLVYRPARGQRLDRVIATGQGETALRLTAQWLARLHSQRLPLERAFDLGRELNNLQAWATRVGEFFPDQAAAALRLAALLREQAPGLTLSKETPIHKDFHYGHVLLRADVQVMDFDEMRRGDPSFDVAHFCAYLHLLAARRRWPGEQTSALHTTFLQAYCAASGWQPDERYAFFYAYTCLKLAKQLSTGSGPRPRPTGASQRAQIGWALAVGERAWSRSPEETP